MARGRDELIAANVFRPSIHEVEIQSALGVDAGRNPPIGVEPMTIS